MATQYIKLRDFFNLLSSNINSVIQPDAKFSTYRFMRHRRFNVLSEFSSRSVGYIPGAYYGWSEARKVDKDRYALWDMGQSRHKELGVSGMCETSESQVSMQDGRTLFSKEEALQVLTQREKSWQQAGYSAATFQPTKAIHYSRSLPKAQTLAPVPKTI